MRHLEARPWALGEQAYHHLASGTPWSLRQVRMALSPDASPSPSHITVPRHREHRGVKKQAHHLHTTPADVLEDAGSAGRESQEEGALCQPSTESTVSSAPFFSAPGICQSWCLPHPASFSGWNCPGQSFCSGKQGWVQCVLCGEAAPNWTRGGYLTTGAQDAGPSVGLLGTPKVTWPTQARGSS